MTISSQSTANPQSLRFMVPKTISVREKIYNDSTEALQSPIATKIFGFPWADQVTVGNNFVEVKKQEWVEWSVLEDPLKGLIGEHFEKQEGSIEENPEPVTSTQSTSAGKLDSPEAKKIARLIEEQINPALASHGGFVVLHSVENDKVFMEMGGGCQGCAMSYRTMKEGIEEAIKELVPNIQEVIDITNHSEGDNPFYT